MNEGATRRAGLRPATENGGSKTRPAPTADAHGFPPSLRSAIARSWPGHILGVKAWIWAAVVFLAAWPWYWLLSGDSYARANPAQYLLDSAGTVATGFLVAVLMLTPLRVLFPTNGIVRALNRHRRLIGVTAFGFALVHLGYFWLHVGGWAGFMKEINKPFIWSGMAAWTLLAVLAITSLHAIVRAMGARGWKRLHRASYVAAALAFYHQAAQQKEGITESLWFFMPLAILEVLRIFRRWMDSDKVA